MASKCVRCGAPLDENLAACSKCTPSFPAANSIVQRTVRTRLSIPVVAILTIGFVGALVFGGGKLANAHAAPTSAAVTASVDGKPVPMGGPAIALLEQHFSGTKVDQLNRTATVPKRVNTAARRRS